jgi:DNA polymerase III subunit gamma/tau
MSLYKKHRPGTFQAMKGNKKILSTIEKSLEDEKKIPSAFLFHGETGTGKTTLARVIKRFLEIDDLDYKEINAGDDRGIDAIRSIIKTTHYAPVQSAYKLYVVDEAHKLTNDAQNALLKPLEDTPKKVIFILLTTEPNKIIKAVQGRCQMYQLSLLTDKEMEMLLIRTAKKEGEKLEEEVLEQIINDALGHPRNALQILEQVLNADPEDRLDMAKQTAAEVSESIALCKALLSGGAKKKIRTILKGLKGQDVERIRRHVLSYAASVILNNDNPKAGLILEEFIEPFYDSGFPGLVYACFAILNDN